MELGNPSGRSRRIWVCGWIGVVCGALVTGLRRHDGSARLVGVASVICGVALILISKVVREVEARQGKKDRE